MPDLASILRSRIDASLQLAQRLVHLRSRFQINSFEAETLDAKCIDTFYEAIFLRVFVAWEDFLEESFIRFLRGFVTSTYSPVLVGSVKPKSLSDAMLTMLGGNQYILWHKRGPGSNGTANRRKGLSWKCAPKNWGPWGDCMSADQPKDHICGRSQIRQFVLPRTPKIAKLRANVAAKRTEIHRVGHLQSFFENLGAKADFLSNSRGNSPSKVAAWLLSSPLAYDLFRFP